MNSNTNVTYKHVCHVSCNIVVMFTCTLVRSHPDSRRRWAETWTAAIKSKIPGWAWQQDACLWGEPEWGSVNALNEAMKDVFARCPEKTAVLVCIIIMCLVVVSFNIYISYHHPCIRETNTWYWLLFIFRRLKINHDVHEFILDSGTIANKKSTANGTKTKRRTALLITSPSSISNQQNMCSAHQPFWWSNHLLLITPHRYHLEWSNNVRKNNTDW
jgi:hypothetical protein